MVASLAVQIGALCRKNWIVIWRHKWANLWRCILYPLIYTSYLVQTQTFYKGTGSFSPGKIHDMRVLPSNLLDLKLVVAGAHQASVAYTLVNSALSQAGVDTSARIQYVDSPADVVSACPENYNAISPCFAAVVFDNVDPSSGRLNYTVRGDFGVTEIDANNPKNDDLQKRFIPLQWAIESTWINMTTGTQPSAPQLWEYTHRTQKEHDEKSRKGECATLLRYPLTSDFVRSLRGFLVVSYVIGWLGILYHIPGKMATERMQRLTEHLEVMGCRPSARLISWHVSISACHVVGWLVTGAILGAGMFKHVNIGYFVLSHLLLGLLLASWSMFVAAPFARFPTIAAITSCGVGVLFAIVGQVVGSNAAAQVILTLVLPPTYLVTIFRTAASWELQDMALNALKKSPDGDAPPLACMVMAVVGIVLYPFLAGIVEHVLYDIRPTHGHAGVVSRLWSKLTGKKNTETTPLGPEMAVAVRHLRKTFTSRRYGVVGRRRETVAIADLSFNVLRGEIFCLLGRNGAAKSTTLGAISGLVSITSGSVRYADDLRIGVASQQDVLWDDLTCAQHIRLWSRIKGDKTHAHTETQARQAELLDSVSLSTKVKALAKTLSGGQKRKLALACALAGGSNLLLLDEVSSGLDPISRRAIWRLILAHRGDATILLTTHFLDEADYLGDRVAILRQPGQLLALDAPMALKARNRRGFAIVVDTHTISPPPTTRYAFCLLERLRAEEPSVHMTRSRGSISFTTGTTDMAVLRRLGRVLQGERRMGINLSYSVGSTTLEEVFLDLNMDNPNDGDGGQDKALPGRPEGKSESTTTMVRAASLSSVHDTGNVMELADRSGGQVGLAPGTHHGPARRTAETALAVAYKRALIFSRSFILPLGATIAVVVACCVPLTFLKGRNQSCATPVFAEKLMPMTYPLSEYVSDRSPPLVFIGDSDTKLSNWAAALNNGNITSVASMDAFTAALTDNRKNITYGGIALAAGMTPVVAFQMGEDNDEFTQGISALNLLSNGLLQQLSTGPVDPFPITANWQWVPSPYTSAFGKAIQWFVFFGLAMAVWPAFASLYPTWEKVSQVRANQYSNGARPVGLWLGHLLAEIPGILLIATVLSIAYATTSQFAGLGYFWLCVVLYGVAGTLYAFLASLVFRSPLASWGFVAFVNGIVFLLYLTMYFLLLTFDKSPAAGDHLLYAHLGYAALFPLASVLRASFVSLNMWSLLCDGIGKNTTKSLGGITLYGGPIAYLIVQSLCAFLLLVYFDNGGGIPSFLRLPFRFLRGAIPHETSAGEAAMAMASAGEGNEVEAEKYRVAMGHTGSDALVMDALTKKFASMPTPSVDDISFGVRRGETFALIGPNGAGKTTTLACIRGVEKSSKGDITVLGSSITHARNAARGELGVCPQANALDANLTVREHLWLYGHLKGVPRHLLKRDVDVLLVAAGLAPKADELAPALSGGNQRKLSLAIALIGDRPVVLVDEFSSGVDPFSKREAWATLAALTAERAVVMTTHSMEEVDALASRVGIIAAKMLAIGTPSTLKSRFATYELHVPAESVPRVLAYLEEHGFSDAARSYDTATRVAVPGIASGGQLDSLLGVLQGAASALNLSEMTLHEASTEAAFLAIVGEHNVREDMFHHSKEKTNKKNQRGRWWHRKKQIAQEEIGE